MKWCQAYATIAIGHFEFMPKGTLSNVFEDAFHISDFVSVCDPVMLQDLLFGSVRSKGKVSKSRVNPWEERIEEMIIGLRWHAMRAWKDRRPQHINHLEVRAWAGLIHRLAGGTYNHGTRIVSIWELQSGEVRYSEGPQ